MPLDPSSDQAIWSKFLTLHAHVERQLALALQRHHGVSLSEYQALADLAQANDGERRMQELADRIGLQQSSVTRLVARLTTLGFVRKDLCPDDKRGVYAVITEEGRRLHTAARGTYTEVLSAALNTAGANQQLARLVQAIRGTS
jgi:DNA-binding MarR family transcriptional regulator